MPTYTYSCPQCGPFSLFRPMSHSALPAPCPSCRAGTSRVYEAPHLGGLSPALERAITQAERSAEAPRVTRHIPPGVRSRRAG